MGTGSAWNRVVESNRFTLTLALSHRERGDLPSVQNTIPWCDF